MSIPYQTSLTTRISRYEYRWLIPKANKLYESEVSANKIMRYSNYGITCEYAFIDSQILFKENKKRPLGFGDPQCLPEKNVKRACGFGICFPKVIKGKRSRIIIFKDLIDPEFLDMAVGHEYAHLVAEEDITDDKDEKKAFTLELKVAELAGKRQEWLDYNEREYPWRIKQMQNFGLLD